MSEQKDKAEAPKTNRSLGQLTGGARVQAIVPTTLGEVFRLGESIYESGLAPDGLKTPQQVTVVMLKGMEINLPPMAALESLGVINGKVCIYGDGIPSLLWSHGFEIDEGYSQKDGKEGLENCIAWCKITRPNGKTYSFEYSAQDAIQNGLWNPKDTGTKPWARYTKRMLRMRCRGWLARDVASDVLKGIPVYEEQRDLMEMKDVTPPQAPLELPDDILPVPQDVAEAETITEAEASQDAPLESPQVYLEGLEENLGAADTQEEFDEIWTDHVDTLAGRLGREDQRRAEAIHERVKEKKFGKPKAQPKKPDSKPAKAEPAKKKTAKKGEAKGSLI